MLPIQIFHPGLAISQDGLKTATPRGGPYAQPTPDVVTSAPGPAVQVLFVGAICGDRTVGKLQFMITEVKVGYNL